MRYEIRTVWGGTIYTADIPDDTPNGMHARAAVESAINARANLSYAILIGADLRGAILRDADLRDADLRGAILRDADLQGAHLGGAHLGGADLRGAILSGSDLRGAHLKGTVGDMRHVKSLQIERYSVAYTATHMQIGCQLHSLTDWWTFNDERIQKMDWGALVWWRKWKPILQQIIELSPAEG
jgi:hypothetical protein